MNDRALKVLLVDDNLEDIQLIEEALSELAEVRFSRSWLQSYELLQADDIREALEVLAECPVDVVFVDQNLSDASGLHAFRRVQEYSPESPVVVLAEEEDEAAALSLVRQGAQDYLLKSEIDCIPLARAIHGAIERQRYRSALRSLVWIDELTGLYSITGLQRAGEWYGSIATRLEQDVRVFVFELDGLEQIRNTHGAQERDMALILTSDILRRVFQGMDLVARAGAGRFVAVTLAETQESAVRERFAAELRQANSRREEESKLVVRVGSASGSPADDLIRLSQLASAPIAKN